MAQEVKIPKFYIDIPQYEQTTGYNGWTNANDALFNLNPVSSVQVADETAQYTFQNPISVDTVFILGHNFASKGATFEIVSDGVVLSHSNIVNGVSEFDGWSMVTIPEDIYTDLGVKFNGASIVSSVVFAKSYSPPFSPDVSLTLNYEFDGVKMQTTKGGATITNTMYSGVGKWGNDLPAWSLYKSDDIVTGASRNGRKSYSLNFSYLAEDRAFPDNMGITNYETEYALNTKYKNGLLDNGTTSNNDMFTMLINRTVGLPFIFIPDSENTAPDQFIIGRIQQETFSFGQTLPAIYSVAMNIRESY